MIFESIFWSRTAGAVSSMPLQMLFQVLLLDFLNSSLCSVRAILYFLRQPDRSSLLKNFLALLLRSLSSLFRQGLFLLVPFHFKRQLVLCDEICISCKLIEL